MYLITTLSSFVCLGYISSVKWPQITRLWKNVTKWTVFSGGSRSSDKGGRPLSKNFFSALRASVWSKKKGGRRAPRALLPDPPLVLTLRSLTPRANGRNIVGQQLPTLLDFKCCVRLHTLLHVVACCCAKFETGQTFEPTTPNISFVPWSTKRSPTMLDPFARFFQHRRGHARSFQDLWVAFFPRCTARPKLVGSCCIRLHTTDNTHATIPNIFGTIMLGVVAPVCTQPNITFYGGRKQASTKFSFSLSEHGYVCLEFGSMRVRLHLTKQASLRDVFVAVAVVVS